MLLKRVLFFVFLSFFVFDFSFANEKDLKTQEKIDEKIESLKKPMYTPFVENYILNEIKTLRDENRKLKVELHEKMAQKEVQMSNYVVNYATSTINNMFYIIAAASSLLVIMGWSSIKDINIKIKNIIDKRISKTIEEYEIRMNEFEKDLKNRSKQVAINQKEIEKTNSIHSLWVRASQESTPYGQIEIYDEILSLRADDVEALAYKAEAILELEEAHWALSVANQALRIDSEYSNALYIRAKVYSKLSLTENAIHDLEHALELNEQYVEEVENEEAFKELLEEKSFIEILEKYKTT